MRLLQNVPVDETVYTWLRTLALRHGLLRGLEPMQPDQAARIAGCVLEAAYRAITTELAMFDVRCDNDNA